MPVFYGVGIDNPLMLGTARYPSPRVMADAFRASGAEIATVSLRREKGGSREFWNIVKDLGVRVLPNTAGCFSVKEAVTTAHMAREVFETPWIKLEVIGHPDTLHPDIFGTIQAARILNDEGFEVFPYCTEDLTACQQLLDAGCRVLMPWGAPIGTGIGLANPTGLRLLRAHFADVPLVIDAGIGLPSQAARAMEMGFDAVLLNTAVARAGDPVAMAQAMTHAVRAGRAAAVSGPMERREMAVPSTPFDGMADLA
ncbi:thiazole synthase [Pontibaca methylaminivorans]|mgnify:CR=1 FL=1|uniref:thiazole synthase n=1 Tax=Pontibaca methylaminivorans TaxID=515897 RepID=UPI002FD8A094